MSKFTELINGPTPVLVDFFATWCGPCQQMAPELQKLAKELGGNAHILKIDIDRNRAAADKYQIRSVPTLILFQNGKQLWRGSGYQNAKALQQLISTKAKAV